LARDGADVALTYARSDAKARDVVADVEKIGRRGRAFAADNADPQAVAGAVDRTVVELGRLDILVNNAGIFASQPIESVTLEDFDHMIAVNVRAVLIAAQAAARHMKEGGRIITIGSNLAERTPGPGVTLYAMSKSALLGLTKGMARDLGPREITVNLVQPGPTDTDMNPADGPQADLLRSFMAIPRFGSGENIAGLVAYLAGAEGGFVTGAALTIDGGSNA
jgi:NAD(P)-dependent dehydrogenase (short-subunit alcohol dehydrogenase family)